MRKYFLLILFVITACRTESAKDKWAKEAIKIKYSKEREKQVWGKILRGTAPELFYGTALYDVATKIKKGNNKGLKEKLAELSYKEINYQEDKFKTTLGHFALRNQNLEAIRILVEAGLNPNVISDNGSSVITSINSSHYSRLPQSLQTLKYLIGKGANVNLVNTKPNTLDRTPLIVAAGSNLANTKLLIEAGANPNFVYKNFPNDQYPESALISALQTKRIDIVNYLIFEVKVDYKVLKNSESVKYNPGGFQILGYLRTMTFSLDSEKYQEKMRLVNYLSKQGLDYFNTPIPDYLKKGKTRNYLLMY